MGEIQPNKKSAGCPSMLAQQVWRPVEAGGQVQKDVWQLANASAITSALLLISVFMTFWGSSRIHLGKAQ